MKNMNKWMMCLVLVGAVTGCRTLGTRPVTPSPSCPEPGPMPKTPKVQRLPPNARLPEGATQMVIGLCPSTGRFLALGVNPGQKTFAYAVSGDRVSSEAFLAQVHRKGIPTTTFTAPVRARGEGSVGTDAVDAGSNPRQGNQGGNEEQSAPPPYDPCTNQSDEIGDKPPPDPEDEGGAVPDGFAALAWRTANAVDDTSDAAPAAKPSPSGTTVPR
ncbi:MULTISPECIES: hypothetical protein [Myxococcus]|uniref:hypothetical protein n=1 Tax=Myxococcus TaxID=32 RepID=UPI0013D15B44|nr:MULTISPECIES: hypothetical protein [Myxococcus]NVJ27114.1 hypothetical protein [Myxococcus sp. AM011]